MSDVARTSASDGAMSATATSSADSITTPGSSASTAGHPTMLGGESDLPLYIGVGVVAGVLCLIIVVVAVVLLVRCRKRGRSGEVRLDDAGADGPVQFFNEYGRTSRPTEMVSARADLIYESTSALQTQLITSTYIQVGETMRGSKLPPSPPAESPYQSAVFNTGERSYVGMPSANDMAPVASATTSCTAAASANPTLPPRSR